MKTEEKPRRMGEGTVRTWTQILVVADGVRNVVVYRSAQISGCGAESPEGQENSDGPQR